MEQIQLKIAAEDQGLRLDQYIINKLKPPISRSRIQRLVKNGQIYLRPATTGQNGVRSTPLKAHYKVKTNDVLLINIPKISAPQVLPEPIPLDIFFEDEDLLVINKPTGMVTHPAAGNYSHTLVNGLLNYGCPLSTVNGPLRPGIVHRLDKDTSGLMVVAKNNFTHNRLASQFKRHTVQRKYIAVVKGRVEHAEGIIDLPIGRDAQNRQKMAVSLVKGKTAKTRYKVLTRYREATVLELTPDTGRTHQLRVHLKFCDHPILGDRRYSKQEGFSRLALHAKALGFRHPRSQEPMSFESELPECFQGLLNTLK